MSTQKGLATKVKIIEAATSLIFKEGLYNVTYAQIANQIGLTQAAIYKHFSDMDDLILQSCLYWFEIAAKHIHAKAAFQPAANHLKSYVAENMKFTSTHRPQDALLLGLYYHSVHSPKLMKAYREMKQGALNRLQELLQRGNLERAWKVSNVEKKALTIHSLMIGEIIKLIIEPQSEKLDQRIQRITDDLFLFLKN